MWPFKAQAGLSEVLSDLAAVRRELKDFALDLDAQAIQLRRISQRVAKRERTEQNTEALEPEGGSGATLSTSPLSPTFSKLTARQQQLQMSILRRRGMNGGP